MQRLWLVLFPPGAQCLVCGDPRRADEKYALCPACREALLKLRLREGICPRCMHPLSDNGACAFCKAGYLNGLRAGYGAYRHAGAARQLVRGLKFDYQDEAAQALAAGMAQCFPAYEYDALVPVPLHRHRQRMRGANQAMLLCQLVGPRTGLTVIDALQRVRKTKTQTALDQAARQRNVRGAFTLKQSVEGLRLLVVDDVRTTGATARACAEVLMQGGAQYVGVLTATIAVYGAKEDA